ncbi:MAG: glycosyltransferase family 2 protein [Nitrososphaera sp.]|nr:glycosyltransferase family 2 protein [Nitrososphaera sp.]
MNIPRPGYVSVAQNRRWAKPMDPREGINKMKLGPRVSVGMPVYNGEKFIRESIGSLLRQSFRDLELIISDNASTDATERICRELASTDGRVRYYSNTVNIGVTENYNKVFRYARGEYFKWASCNDVCAQDFIQHCVDVLDQRPDVVLCYPKTGLFDTEITSAEDYADNLDLQEEDPRSRFLHLIERIGLNNALNGVIRTEVLGRIPLHKHFSGSDINLIAELCLYGKFVEVPERLFYRRINANAHSGMLNKTQVQQRFWPHDKKAMLFRLRKSSLEYFAAVLRSPLTYRDKHTIFLRLLKRIIRARGLLIRELRADARS